MAKAQEPKMVKVRVLKQFSGVGYSYGVGAEIQLPSKRVAALVKAGIVERAEYNDADFKKTSKELAEANKTIAKLEREIAELKEKLEGYADVADIAKRLSGLAKK